MIRRAKPVLLSVALFATLAACSDEKPAAQRQSPDLATATAPLPADPAKPVAPEPVLALPASMPPETFACDSPHVPHDSEAFDDLIKTLSAGDVVDQGGEEGVQEYTLFPADPRRTLTVTIGPTAQTSVGAVDLTAQTPQSAWTLPGGLKMGATLEAVEKASGGPFKLWLTGDGAVADDLGGALNETPNCRYWLNFKPTTLQKGAPRHAMSDEPDVRAMDLRVSRFGLSHVNEQ